MEADSQNYKSMNLQTIPNTRKTYQKGSSIDVSDIEGARPKFIQKPRLIRQTFTNRNDDIQKSTSNIIIPKSVNKVDRQLKVDDIQGTRTKVNKFTSTRNTNPLAPSYQLPQCEYMPFPQPKFIKDNMMVDDIEGTRMRETFALRVERSGKTLEKDITPFDKPKFVPKKDNFLFDVNDINLKNKDVKGDRCLNPLEPVYKVATTKDERPNYDVGFIEGSKPTVLRERVNPVDYSLCVGDIPGAVAKPRREVKTKKQVIQETQTGSLKRGISSTRRTNPLAPQYSYLGASQEGSSHFTRPKTAAQRLDAFLLK